MEASKAKLHITYVFLKCLYDAYIPQMQFFSYEKWILVGCRLFSFSYVYLANYELLKYVHLKCI